jgi:hypothetical protein
MPLRVIESKERLSEALFRTHSASLAVLFGDLVIDNQSAPNRKALEVTAGGFHLPPRV